MGIKELIGQKECNLIVNFSRFERKADFDEQTNFNANTVLVALFEIRFRIFFFDAEKR